MVGTFCASVAGMSPMFHALVVEDNPQTLKTLTNALTRLGYIVNSADTAEGAIDELNQNSYDAVFAELCLRGGQGGRGIARIVKKLHHNAKFFIVTSWKGDLEPGMLLIDGIDGIIRKPIIFNEIRDNVLEHFG